MLFREEYLEKVIRPKVMDAAEHKPKTIYDLCDLFGLPPNSIHTVSAWLRELKIPVGDICELSLRARRMMESRGFTKPRNDSSVADLISTATTTEIPDLPKKKRKKLLSKGKTKDNTKSKKFKKRSGKPGTKSKSRRHI